MSLLKLASVDIALPSPRLPDILVLPLLPTNAHVLPATFFDLTCTPVVVSCVSTANNYHELNSLYKLTHAGAWKHPI